LHVHSEDGPTLQDTWAEKQKHFIAEFIGTAGFTFLAAAAAVNAESAGLITGAIGGGLALAVMIYATVGDNCSKGRLNPAVSLGYLITGRETQNVVILEIISQFLGGLVGGILLKMSLPHTDLTVPLLAMGGPSTTHPLATFIWEFLATAFLVYTVFAVVEDRQAREPPQSDASKVSDMQGGNLGRLRSPRLCLRAVPV